LRLLRDPKQAARGLLVLALLTLAIAFAPWATGARTPVLRDVLGTHRPLKAFGAAELAAGRVPTFLPAWALGQPFRGNPNALPFYPGNLAYLVLPFPIAFALHYPLHLGLALAGGVWAGRRLGLEPFAAAVAGLTYAGSGFALTGLSFYNLLAVVAWLPWVAGGLAGPSRRALLLAGLACGLVVLGGEPVSALLAAPVLLAVAWRCHGVRRGSWRLAVVATLGALVAAPQIVATLRVLPFSYRFAHGLEGWEAIGFGYDWRRLLELVLPLPWGSPRFLDERGYWSPIVTPRPPYVWTAYLGVLPIALLAGSWRRSRGLAAVAGGALALALLASGQGELVSRLTGGLFRYPEKLLLPFTLAAALLTGLELEHRRRAGNLSRSLAVTGGLLGASGLALWAARGMLAPWLGEHLAGAAAPPHVSEAVVRGWAAASLAGAALLLLGALANAKGAVLLIGALQLLSLAQLAPLVVADRARHYPPGKGLIERVPAGAALVVVPAQAARWEESPGLGWRVGTPERRARLAHFELHPAFGVERGFSYPIASDLEGMSSPLSVFLERNLPRVPWPGRIAWLRRLGVDGVVRHDPQPEPIPGLRRVELAEQFGVAVELSRVERPFGRSRWPAAVVPARDPREAFWRVATGEIGEDQAVVSRPLEHDPRSRFRVLLETPDEIRFEVSGGGGLAVLGRSYWPIYRARLEDGGRLPTQPVDLVLLGIEVPAGQHRVTVDVAHWPESSAGLLSLMTLAGLGLAARRPA